MYVHATTMDLDGILDWAALSWASYSKPDRYRHEVPSTCSKRIEAYGITSVADGVIMARRGKETVLAFRGTVDLRDVRTDVEIWREKPGRELGCVDGVLVHDGFANAFEKVFEACMDRVSLAFRESDGVLITTGHSLGGALASMCALCAASRHPKNDVRCVTFGSPAVGNAAFVTSFAGFVRRSIRVVHEKDPVPKMLPAFWFPHVETRRSIEGEVVLPPDASHEIFRGLLSRLWKYLMQAVEGDLCYHSLSAYVACLERLYDARSLEAKEVG